MPRQRQALPLFSLVLTLLLCTLASYSPPVLTQGNSSTFFFDSFEQPVQSRWTTSGVGTWRVDNGEYVVDMGDGYNLLGTTWTGNVGWTDYIVEVDVKGELGVDKHVVFRYTDLGNYYAVNLRGAPFNDVLLLQAKGGSSILLQQISVPNSPNVWYRLKIRVEGPKITIFVDNQQVTTYTDANNPLLQGAVGFQGWTGAWGSNRVRYDNVLVRSLQELPCDTSPTTGLDACALEPGDVL